MKILSRPDNATFGTGAYTIHVDLEELQYIAALTYITRLGQGPYECAAYNLIGLVEEMFGPDFIEEAANTVDLHISVLEDDGDTVKEQFCASEVCVEV